MGDSPRSVPEPTINQNRVGWMAGCLPSLWRDKGRLPHLSVALKRTKCFVFFFFYCSQIAVPSKALRVETKQILPLLFIYFLVERKRRRRKKLIKPAHSLGVVYKGVGTESNPSMPRGCHQAPFSPCPCLDSARL